MPAAPAKPWVKVWSDSFNGEAGQSLSTSTWKFDTGQGTFGTGEIERNTTSTANVRLDGHGNLQIVPLRDGPSWTSGGFRREHRLRRPGLREMMAVATLKQPQGADLTGYWPGFWLLGPGIWPMTGEIDILEDVDSATHYSGTLHCGNLTDKNPDGTTGPCHEGNGFGSGLRPCPTCDTTYQTYAVVVDRRNAADEQIRWYHNGHEYFSVSESRVGTTAWDAGRRPRVPHHPRRRDRRQPPQHRLPLPEPHRPDHAGSGDERGQRSVYDLKPAPSRRGPPAGGPRR